ncbi:STAS/SEC14 domain-containing protein [Palleronia abyssalis]|uniref:Uncharacterized protein n=1 Tax=Palleronia abyssalis TaxID=1501240 RepID=A0A2R8BXF1_9RHOB|nr:STAS/SEC14 domain-containing protein [Palleronia abyssalis]SPJ24838.1 hypothetical protein PAA8504_02678 [Palleronia abyssalis]
MFTTPSVREEPTDTGNVFAFHIVKEVSAEDMTAMSEYMNAQFDTHDKVSMLLIFDHYDGAETGASLNLEALKARFRSLAKVERYGVVNAPDRAAKLIETMGAIIPVEAKTFDREDDGWSFVGARPKGMTPGA